MTYFCPHCGKELDKSVAVNEICPHCHKVFNIANLNPKQIPIPRQQQPELPESQKNQLPKLPESRKQDNEGQPVSLGTRLWAIGGTAWGRWGQVLKMTLLMMVFNHV